MKHNPSKSVKVLLRLFILQTSFLLLIVFNVSTYGKTVRAYCDINNDCVGGCVATGNDAYCTAVNCACACIYSIGENWYHYSINCPAW
jgi:hypothetical protein